MKQIKILLVALVVSFTTNAQKNKQPNILVIWGDDVAAHSLSTYHRGVGGAKTPNIDRIGSEGILFTDAYGEQSCTAGRSAFALGQHPVRSGLSKVGLPGAPQGISELDPTIAVALKELGYTTGQFGKNHLGDNDKHLPTNHGFDEFFGNLYHLNAEEEPEEATYPKDPEFKKKFGPRGVIHSTADGSIKDTGPLTKKRMETADEEFRDAAFNFMEGAVESEQPFFVWLNFSRMHIWTRLKEESKRSGFVYRDGLEEHDGMVGEVLDFLQRLAIEENTIVIYSTDNGPMLCMFPDAGTTPYRGEKATTWEGGVRVPLLIRWPAQIEPNQISNEIISHTDMFPTLVAAAGNSKVSDQLKKGASMNNRDYKVHLDGYNFMPYFTGKEEKGPRDVYIYSNDDGEVTAVRMNDWKVHYKIQEHVGMDAWVYPWTTLRLPLTFNLKEDPYERSNVDGDGYYDWYFRSGIPYFYKANDEIGKFMQTFKEFPRRSKAGSFTIE